ncbi:DUF1071 domain-containing protein [Hydrogenophaga sp. IBVHS1]|uniref:Sak single strand annealing protein n=1 Tax=unclassified Hydrogenophaga TaxID=2610897 RepID=UPI000A2D5B85|nr:DUF1071 domain-containing protein [Hydrogenophaga sp. IBVHS1]OSZ74624.1 hypothetical protein CAP37_03970 [Hydrogenophaga sp. IBVHS1]
MTDTINHFARLNVINVNEHLEKKGGFSYLSWPYAVAQLRTADATATWEVQRFHGLPYLATEAGVFVEVAVTVQGVRLSQIHPVLDGRNRPLQAPTAFDINTSLQRCLVKAIALHGLGLYIYAGEDLPQAVMPEDFAPIPHPSSSAAAATHAAANDESVVEPDGAPQPAPRGHKGNPAAPACITKAQQAQIHKLAIEVGVELARVLSYFGVQSLAAIPATDFLRVVRSLEKRRAA